MSLVVDASVVIAALTDGGSDGEWAETTIAAGGLVAPYLVQVESANILRRLRASGRLDAEQADSAYRDLLDLPIDLLSFEPFADRIWQLKENVTSYDAWYVAIAEAFDLQLATLDRRLARASGVRCEVRTPA